MTNSFICITGCVQKKSYNTKHTLIQQPVCHLLNWTCLQAGFYMPTCHFPFYSNTFKTTQPQWQTICTWIIYTSKFKTNGRLATRCYLESVPYMHSLRRYIIVDYWYVTSFKSQITLQTQAGCHAISIVLNCIKKFSLQNDANGLLELVKIHDSMIQIKFHMRGKSS